MTLHPHSVSQEPSAKGAASEAPARLLKTARRLFAERGLAATSIRDLALEAGVNIAAVNYHFGSKENLYLETLRFCYREGAALNVRTQHILERAIKAGTQKAAMQGIREYIREFLEALFHSEEAALQARLMIREMSDPTPALKVIIDEFISPKKELLVTLIAQARPALRGSKDLPLYASSIIGQCLHSRTALPVILHFLNEKEMTSELLDQMAEHIANFSQAGVMHADDFSHFSK